MSSASSSGVGDIGTAAHGADREDDEIMSMIEKGGCSKIYFELETCLGENDRDWTKVSCAQNTHTT